MGCNPCPQQRVHEWFGLACCTMPGRTRAESGVESRAESREERPRGAVASAFARAGLVGNPSDSYAGKAIAFSVRNFSARVAVEPSDRFEIRDELATPLLQAAIRRFEAHTGIVVAPLRISLETDIPFQVGLAGSSAIVIAALRALSIAQGADLHPFDQSELALAAEVVELGIAAGPMDRVVQAYEGLIQMDFGGARSPACYTRLNARLLPPMLIAWDPAGGEASTIVHSDLRDRWQRGETHVHQVMSSFRDLVDEAEIALRAGDHARLRAVVDRNFETRAKLCGVAERDREMVELARRHGAAAKQCGSGGACLVVLASQHDAEDVAAAYRQAGYRTVVPSVDSDRAD